MSLMDRHFADMVSRLTTSTRYTGAESAYGCTASGITARTFTLSDIGSKEAPVAVVPATFKLEPGFFYAAVIVPRTTSGMLTADSEFLGYACAAGNSAEIREELRKQGTLSRLKGDSACVLIGAWITVTGDIASYNSVKPVSAVLVEECSHHLERSAWMYRSAAEGNRDFPHLKPMAKAVKKEAPAPVVKEEAPAPVPEVKEAPAQAKKAPAKKASKKKESGVVVEPNTFYAAALVHDGPGDLRDEDIVAVTPAGEFNFYHPDEVARALGRGGMRDIPKGQLVVVGVRRTGDGASPITFCDSIDAATSADDYAQMIAEAVNDFHAEQRAASPTSSSKSLPASEPAVTPVGAIAPAIVTTTAAAAAAIVLTPEPAVEPVITKQEPPMAATPSTPASTNPTDASTELTPHSDWNRRILSSGMEGAKDGAAAAAAEAVTNAALSAIGAAFPSSKMWVDMVNGTDIGRATLLLLTPLLIGHLTLVMPGIIPGNPETVRAICDRAFRATVSGKFASFLTNLRVGLASAFQRVEEIERAG
jgi:hypothetical protein